MATAELSAFSARPAGSRAARRGRPTSRVLAAAVAAVLALTGAGVLAGAVDPALAGARHPHPTLTGTLGEAASILAHNLRALAAPFLLIIVGFPAARIPRTVGDLAIAAMLTVNCVAVGIAVGRWQGRLLPYLPHLPLEFSALACATSAWLIARDDAERRRELAMLALATIALLVGAACLETWATPRRSTRAAAGAGQVGIPSDQASPRRVAVGGLPSPRFCAGAGQSLQGRCAPFPSPRLGSARPPGRRFRARSTTTDPQQEGSNEHRVCFLELAPGNARRWVRAAHLVRGSR